MNEAEKKKRSDVAVVGAGLIGLASAWELATRGLKVTVFERDAPGSGATRVAAGMLAPIGELEFGEPELLSMSLRSRELYSGFANALEAASGIETGYRETGALHVALDRDEAGELRRSMELQQSHGFDSDWLGPIAARELEPGISPSLAGAVLVEGDAVVDPRALVEALGSALAGAGVEIIREEVKGLLRGGNGQVEGVVTNQANFPAGSVLAAPGAEAGAADWIPEEVRPPVRPVKGQVAELRGDPRSPACSRILGSERVYLAPRPDGRLIVGATVEEMGFDRTVTAGGVYELLREAYRLLPDVAEMEFIGIEAGLRPATPDNLPVIGSSGIDGLVIATGHFRNGILLAPITARAVAGLIVDGAAGEEIGAASPTRFKTEEL